MRLCGKGGGDYVLLFLILICWGMENFSFGDWMRENEFRWTNLALVIAVTELLSLKNLKIFPFTNLPKSSTQYLKAIFLTEKLLFKNLFSHKKGNNKILNLLRIKDPSACIIWKFIEKPYLCFFLMINLICSGMVELLKTSVEEHNAKIIIISGTKHFSIHKTKY